MMNTELHAQKVTILSRLIKESSLTLEEALLLLKEEEVKTPAFVYPYTSITGTSTGFITGTTTGLFNTTYTNPSVTTADLNT